MKHSILIIIYICMLSIIFTGCNSNRNISIVNNVAESKEIEAIAKDGTSHTNITEN